MTVSEVAIIRTTATATTPPIMAEVLSHSQLVLSAWQTSVAGTNKKSYTKVNYEANSLPPVEKSMGVLSVVPATLVADTVSV